MSHARAGSDRRRGKEFALLALGALGVVYGDIGTSPLYAIKEAFTGHSGVAPTRENVLGVASLIFWAINFVISFKYIGFVLRADNRGEGGILALLALVRPRSQPSRRQKMLIAIGLFGAALLYGDGIITPAISVLGAMEGLAFKAPALERWVIWISLGILGTLFYFQKHGTERVGRVFGPVTAVWFICIAALGLRGIMIEPAVLAAVNPWYAIDFLIHGGKAGYFVLGAVVLVVTGGEALYADMGHFGKRPIRFAWFSFVLPALLLNYFGQSALLLRDPAAAESPFYALVPSALQYPMIAVATAAAIVASQALISGAYSLTQQAVQLGFSPRVTIVHTSSKERGQIYIPEVNAAVGIGCMLLVLTFRNSSNLAAAYGIAVTGTMIVTSLLFYRVTRDRFGWPLWKAGLLLAVFMTVDVAFFLTNLPKLPQGGWVPIAVASVVFLLMSTWKKGRAKLAAYTQEVSLPLSLFLDDIERKQPTRVPGVAVFLTSATGIAPPVLLHHLKHNKVLHEKVIMLSVITEEVPMVTDEERLEVNSLGEGFWQVIVRTGFMESPDVPAALAALGDESLGDTPGAVSVMQTTFYLGRETLIPSREKLRNARDNNKLSYWRKRLFIIMTRNNRSATQYFCLPPNRVVELGAQIQF